MERADVRTCRKCLADPTHGSKPATGPRDLNEVVVEVFTILSPQAAARDVKLDKELTSHRLVVTGDRVQLQQVILNLIVNGIDAMADMPNGAREISCRSWARDGTTHISLRDAGKAIPPEQLESLFEPF